MSQLLMKVVMKRQSLFFFLPLLLAAHSVGAESSCLQEVVVGDSHACALNSSTSLPVCWGTGNQCSPSPVDTVPADTPFSSLSAGICHSCGIRVNDSMVQCWGEWDIGDGRDKAVPDKGPGFTKVSSGAYHSCGLEITGRIRCWGCVNRKRKEECWIHPDESMLFKDMACGSNSVCGVDPDGDVTCWGYDWNSTVPAGAKFAALNSASQSDFEYTPMCGVLTNGSVACFGPQGGDYEGMMDYASPNSEWGMVVAGTESVCALKARSGDLSCWGTNAYGQNELPTNVSYSELASGCYVTCGIAKKTGVLECVGNEWTGIMDIPLGGGCV